MQVDVIYNAIFALINGKDGFVTTSQRMRIIEEVGAESMPALDQLERGIVPIVETMDGVAVVVYKADWWIYVNQADGSATSSSVLNPLIESVTALLPEVSNTATQFTAGGITGMLQYDGDIAIYEGLLDTKSAVQIPIKCMVPVS